MDVDAGGQGNMFGYASDETMDRWPPPGHSIATVLGRSALTLRTVTYGDCAQMA